MAAPAPKATGKAVAGCNYVANDEIWKSHVKQEWAACKKWPRDWGFMTQSYKELAKEYVVDKADAKPQIELPAQLRPVVITPVEKYIKIGATTAYPKTTTGLVGWRSTRDDCSLENYGSYARGKGGLIKQLNWPMEGIM